MQLFTCSHCGQPVYFDNTFCAHCGNQLGFDAIGLKMVSLSVDADGHLAEQSTGQYFHYCQNHQHDVCNWVIPDEDPATFCLACALNRTIPDINQHEYLDRWKKIESAKHRLIYALQKWQLPVFSKAVDEEKGLIFDFKADNPNDKKNRVLTGHADGVITMNIAEADDVEREMAKNNMDEVYRTVLGHFRHEVGHYYWDLLIADSPYLHEFRQIFGDETYSYQDALDKHYQEGAPTDWQRNYISSYATMHPWEDWAETWAHYLHIVDTLETGYSFGLAIHPLAARPQDPMSTNLLADAYDMTGFEAIYNSWLPVTFVMNSINRSMGEQDLYPFVINDAVKNKLAFIHKVIHKL